LQRILLYSVPLIFASLGEVMSQRTGVLNIGLEGYILLGAYIGYKVSLFTSNVFYAFISAISAVLLISLIVAFMVTILKVDQIVCGIAIWLFIFGLTAFDYQLILSLRGIIPTLPKPTLIEIPYLSKIPIIGGSLFTNHPLFYISIAVAIIFWFILEKTSLGLYIKASGDNPKSLKLYGVDPLKIRFLCVLICGACAGLAGAYITNVYTCSFMPGISAGRGFVALAIVACAGWAPIRALGISLLFGMVYTFQDVLRAIVGPSIPYEFFLMLPYLTTLLITLRTKTQKAMPRMLGIPFLEE
jgi:simple sugar transport system permease protein